MRMFLLAVFDHPWATRELILAVSGLARWELTTLPARAAGEGWVELVRLREAERRQPARWCVTEAGARRLGHVAPSLSWRRAVLLRALLLDAARSLLVRWSWEVEILWSVSPYPVARACVRTAFFTGPLRPPPHNLDARLRPIDLAALACVRLANGEHLNAAVLVDPGYLKVDWFFHQMRALHAWGSRPAFRARPRAFPLVVMIAANEARREQLVQVWRDLAPYGQTAGLLRVTTYAELAEAGRAIGWWNERNERRSNIWAGAVAAAAPSARPEQMTPTVPPTPRGRKEFKARRQVESKCWWGAPTTEAQLLTPPAPSSARSPGSRVARVVPRRRTPRQHAASQVVFDHLRTSHAERRVLDCIGQYPLITLPQLVSILGGDTGSFYRTTRRLAAHQLIWAPEGERGWLLSGSGLALLAAQAGLAPGDYARLRRWPVRSENGRPTYSPQALLGQREHTRLILSFLSGLCRRGPAAGLRLVEWDHVQCAYDLTEKDDVARQLPALRALQLRLIPDASGLIDVPVKAAETRRFPFWLEVHRAGKRGRELTKKLVKYYRAQWGRGTRRALPRLLVVVGRNDEERLQALRRRFRALDRAYHTRLDVRLTRADLLVSGREHLDPTRRVWRTPYDSTFALAFQPDHSTTAKGV
jgi:hypothetical protein